MRRVAPPIIVPAAVTSLTLIDGLDGNSAKGFTIFFRIYNATASILSVQLFPNGTTTNQKYTLGGTIGTGSYFVVVPASGFASGRIDYFATTAGGIPRFMISQSAAATAGGDLTVAGNGMFGVQWNETTTNITSFVVTSDVAASINVGSEFEVFKWL